MSKYIIIANGELVTDSKALDRAKEYATWSCGDEGEAHIYQFVKTIHRHAITESTKLPCNVLNKPEQKSKSRNEGYDRMVAEGRACPRWTDEEQQILIDFAESIGGDLSDFALAQEIQKNGWLSERTDRAIAVRISKLRVEGKLKP